MATESPIRIVETGGKWLHKEAAIFEPSSANVAAEALGLLAKGQKFQDNGKDVVLNRSESAPPSIGGSFAAIENLMSQNFSMYADITNLGRANRNCESEQLHTDPANLAYYYRNVNLNPRFPPSNISLENEYLVHQVGNTSDNRKLTSFHGSATSSLQLSQSNLRTQEEEFEDSRSPHRALDDSAGGSSGFWSGQDATSSSRHKSSVDLSQEDDSHTLSPVYNESSSSSHAFIEEAGDCDANSNLHNPSLGMSNAITSIPGADNMGLSLNTDSPTTVSNSISLDGTGSAPVTPPLYGRRSNTRDVNEVLVIGVSHSDVSSIESEMKALNVSGLPNVNYHKNQKDQKYSCQTNMLQQPAHQQQSHTFGFQGAKSQMFSKEMNPTYIGMNQFLHGTSLCSTDLQPILHSSGFSPSPFATAAAYMTPSSLFYPNLQLSGYFSPQYSVGTYPLNTTALGPFVAGYSPDSSIPVAFDGSAVPSFSTQTFGGSSCGTTANVVDMQHLNKFYGQLGFATQPSFTDPLHMQYFQQPFSGAYNDSSQFDPLVSRDASTGNRVGALDLWRGADLVASSANQKLQHQVSGGRSNLNIRKGGITSPCYFGSTNDTDPFVWFHNSSAPSPVLPGSPASGAGFPGGRNEMRFLPGSGRNTAIYSGWQGRGGLENSNDPKSYSFLEELRSGKGRRFDLIDIEGHIVEFSADQHGSRFIQQKLENCNVEEKASVFKEVLPHASELMIDVFGNYVIQKFFEYGSQEQRKELANRLEGQILPLSLQMYGCRVIQKALEVIDLELKIKLVHELDGHVLRCVHDQNGNHVIQKCIERIPMGEIGFIISAFHGQVAKLSMHPYGCRVIQRLLEHCTDELQSQFLVDEILESVCALAQDQYGNYVTQHVLERGKPHERSQIIKKLSGHILQMSQHKFASNVVEKCLDYGDSSAQELLIGEIIGRTDGNDNLLTMMKDQYANYVVQKILKTCTENQREMLLSRISFHLNALKKYTYGKHIVARFEQLYGEEIQTSE